jgi:hypothetical protein
MLLFLAPPLGGWGVTHPSMPSRGFSLLLSAFTQKPLYPLKGTLLRCSINFLFIFIFLNAQIVLCCCSLLPL